jgi:hypothetical protein
VKAVAADKSEMSQREKVVICDQLTQFIAEPQTFSRLPNSQCNTLVPSYAFPSYVAGSPLAANILKCQLKLLDLRGRGGGGAGRTAAE